MMTYEQMANAKRPKTYYVLEPKSVVLTKHHKVSKPARKVYTIVAIGVDEAIMKQVALAMNARLWSSDSIDSMVRFTICIVDDDPNWVTLGGTNRVIL